ncbi:L,D-transpeptidase family protein [Enterovirga rhinocerotis]|uniref:L,D-transpeptidase-like protein n=1 Tax=Enterovirga rhinocerotis TaxID=1339210 RepID=A0A4R7BRB4_9HYPH|nr:L,D-transpeptidase family protein [Enterovirga rhinocerotis]TDR88220.1 L,D-transpeptidase-like protein [Enterovirga rhinocerotis]
MRRSGWLAAGCLVLSLAGLAIGYHVAGPDTPPLSAAVRADAILIEKAAHRMALLKGGQTIAVYRVSLGRGGSAPKRREGDHLVPEGAYRIETRNPRSAYHLSLKISYPSAEDGAAAAARGEPPGSNIMIHGIRNGFGWLGRLHRLVDWTAGCIAVTDAEMESIWRAVPDGTPVEIRA